MKSIFDRVVAEYAKRKNLHEQIKEQSALINFDKIAIDQDLFNCFHYMRLEEKFVRNLEQYVTRLSQAPCFLLPNTLLKTAAREELEEHKAWLLSNPQLIKDRREHYGKMAEVYVAQGISYDVDEQMEEYLNPTTSRAYYVGDYLAAKDSAVNLKNSFALSALLYGEGDQALEVVTKLRQVPDYSHHFPNRPPRNGDGSKKKEDAPRVVIPGMPVPVGR